jgi:prophage antirepressor-like protein
MCLDTGMNEFDEDKLMEIMYDYDVKISKKGSIFLYDLVKEVIKSKNPKIYIKKLGDYDPYITPYDCIEILKNAKSKECRQIITKIRIDHKDTTSIIDVKENIFCFEGHIFVAFYIVKDNNDWDVWIKASEIAAFLGYKNPSEAINDNIDKYNLIVFSKLYDLLTPSQQLGAKKIDKKTLFCNLSGFMNLIHKSDKPMSKKIRKWIDDDVVPSIIKYGVYCMQPNKLNIKNFYNDNAFHKFDKLPVLYIAFIGRYDGLYLFKYGLSRDFYRREFKEHHKQFSKFEVVFIEECYNCEIVEELFEKDMITRNLHQEIIINGKNQTELFTVTTKYTYEDVIKDMHQLITDNPSKDVKNANHEIVRLGSVVDVYQNHIDIGKLDKEIQQKMCDFKNSDNYKLELETQVKLAEIRYNAEKYLKDRDIEMKNKDIELEKLHIKRIAMEKDIPMEITEFKPIIKKVVKRKSRKEIIDL